MQFLYSSLKSLQVFVLLMLLSIMAFAIEEGPNGKIAGTVKTTDGKPAPDVTVTIKELGKVTSTLANGTYIFQRIKPGNYTIIMSYVGAKTNVTTAEVTAGKTTNVNFALSESSSELKEVTVSAGRTINNTKLSIDKAGIAPLDLPQSVGIVNQQVIADQQATRLGDVVRNVSGVTLTQTRGGVGETFSARGYSIGIGGGSGSIFKNGVLTNTAGFPEVAGLESVEVLKGSSALMYGNVSGGLIINMITKKPKFESGGEVSMQAGSYSAYKPVVDVYGPINKDLAYRAIAAYDNEGSYRNGVKTERAYFNPSLLYNLGKSTTLLVEGDYLRSNLTPDWGVGSLNNGTAIPTTVPRSQFINTSWAYSHMNQYGGDVTLNHAFSDTWHLNFIASSQHTDIDSYGSSLPNKANAAGDWTRNLQRANTTENNYTGQVNLNGHFNTGSVSHNLLIGTDATKVLNLTNGFTVNGVDPGTYAYDKINIINLNQYTQRTDEPLALNTTLTHAPVYRFGSYIQDLVTIVPKLKALVGVRWSYQRTTQTTIDSLQKGKQIKGAAVTKDDKAFSPKFALIYEPLTTTSIYATYSNNFIVNAGTDYNGRALDPSIVDQYEAGIKNEFLNGKLSANLSVYRIINSNLSVTDPAHTAFKMLNGQTTSDGFEVDVNGSFSKYLYFIAGYGYNNARYTKTSGLTGSSVQGERLIINPKNTANLSGFYTFHNSKLNGLKVGASLFYTGDRLTGFNSTYTAPGVIQYRTIPVNGFATVDLSAGYTYRKFSILARLSNITNTMNYLVHDNYSITPIAPRQFLTTVSYRF